MEEQVAHDWIHAFVTVNLKVATWFCLIKHFPPGLQCTRKVAAAAASRSTIEIPAVQTVYLTVGRSYDIVSFFQRNILAGSTKITWQSSHVKERPRPDHI